ncbi:MAG: SRPBCC domain-containing protein [Myxococcaceae bacterium]|nr:SRPBCC domain-containing protein [Myxococcaceae bacterium]
MRSVLLVTALALAGCTTVRQVHDPATLTPDGKAVRTRTDDALDYGVATFIAATPETVWAVLTDAKAFTRWNSTLVRFEGQVALGQKVELVSKVAPDRTFSLTVSAFDAPRAMVWEDGNGMFLGVRHFTLTPKDQGTVLAMSETYSGFFLGSAEKKMPDFTANFETFAQDLKREAEARAQAGTAR